MATLGFGVMLMQVVINHKQFFLLKLRIIERLETWLETQNLGYRLYD